MIVLGDSNIHVDVHTNSNTKTFMDALDTSNLVKHVKQATHVRGHIFDLLITWPTELKVDCFELDNSVDADHDFVIFKAASIPKWHAPKRQYRLDNGKRWM